MPLMTSTANQPASTAVDAPASDEWTVDRLDLRAYLARIGFNGNLDTSVETLFALHRAHAFTIPFENLDIILGRGVSLDLDALQDKVVRHQRGGYCFEHNLLFAALLERIGFTVRRHLGRVLSAEPGRIQPRTHMTINVDAEGSTWHADVGFGTALSEPIPLIDGTVANQGGWSHALAHREDGWVLRSLGPEGWSDRYIYTQEPQHHIDYVAASHYTSTHPASHFVQSPVVVRLTPRARYRLHNLELHMAMADGTTERRQLAADEVAPVLETTFGLHLAPDDLKSLTVRLTG